MKNISARVGTMQMQAELTKRWKESMTMGALFRIGGEIGIVPLISSGLTFVCGSDLCTSLYWNAFPMEVNVVKLFHGVKATVVDRCPTRTGGPFRER